jgi:hypothetical protein
MNKILFAAIMMMFIFACSEDDTTELLQPTIETIKLESVGIGDIITILGKDFNEKGTYSVKFNEVEGKVTEIKPTYLKVEVPENATSGDITLTYDGITSKAGVIIITKFPTVESIIPVKVKIGETITITGTDFTVGETYVVKFKDIQGTVKEIDPKFLKVEIPEGALSGDVILTYKDESKVIGNIEIEANTQENKLYIVRSTFDDSENILSSELILYNPLTNAKTVLLNLGFDEFIGSPVFGKNIIHCIGEGDEKKLYNIDIKNETVSTIILATDNNSVDHELIIGNESQLYSIKLLFDDSENILSSELVLVDPINDTKTVLFDLGLNEFIGSSIFDKNLNLIYCIGEGEENRLYTIDISNKSISSTILNTNNESISQDIILGKNSKLYAIRLKFDNSENILSSELVLIDPTNNTKTVLFNLSLDEFIYSAVIDKNLNLIYCLGESDNNKLYTIDISNKNVSSVTLGSDSNNISQDIVISN